MKQIILFALFALFADNAISQDGKLLIVDDVKGTAISRDGKEKKELRAGMRMNEDCILILSKKDTLVLLDPVGLKQYTLHGSFTGTLKKYVKQDQESGVKATTEIYMNHLLKMLNDRLVKKHSLQNNEIGRATTVREWLDLFEQTDSITTEQTDSIIH